MVLWVAMLLMALVAAACGGEDEATDSAASVAESVTAAAGAGGDTDATTEATESAESTAAATGEPIKVGLVTDVGGLNDKGFNELANTGLQQAASELGAQVEVRESKADTDYVPNLQYFAAQEYDLIIGVGFLMTKSIGDVAKKFPDINFAIVDASVTDEALAGVPNVAGLVFKENEAGYLVGYLAGALHKQGGFEGMTNKNTISSVGGLKIPPVDKFIAGYQQGAKDAFPEIKTLNGYSQDFVAQDKCKELANSQIGQGSDTVFQVAGGCGLGALEAAKEKGVWGIGVDKDQKDVNDRVLASAIKVVDQAVFRTAKSVQDGSFKGGEDVAFGLAEEGVGIASIHESVPQEIQDEVQAQADKIKNGEITVNDTVE